MTKRYKPEYTDLRSITRCPDRCKTLVFLEDLHRENQIKWLHFGQARLRRHENRDRPEWTLDSYLTAGVTDFEHDSCYALSLPIIGLSLLNIYYQQAEFIGWVSTEGGEPYPEFRVPRPGYNPLSDENSHMCESHHCDEPHRVVAEGFYLPPFDEELYRAVAGKRVRILLGPFYPKDE